jgi:hypothetical protein
MREPYTEGVATHGDPESCVGPREGPGEALTGGCAGTVWSREIIDIGTPTPLGEVEGETGSTAIARCALVPRGQRPVARTEPARARTGRSHVHRQLCKPVGSGRPKAASRS